MVNSKSPKAEIQAYLDSIGIDYNDDATKAELLELVPVTEPKLNEADQAEEVIESEVVEDIPDVELEEVDVEEVPDLPVADVKPKPEVKEPMRFTKWQLVYQSSFSPQQKDIFKLALEDNVPYTLEEVWILVDEFIESLWW
jgi:hypothetical protein